MPAVDYNVLFEGKSPLDSSVEGFKNGLGIQQAMLASEQAKQADVLQKQMRVDLATLSGNANAKPADYASMMVKYPQLSEHFKRGFDVLDKGQQQDKLSTATQVYASINAGRNDVAIDMLKERATALRNGGDEAKAKEQEALAELIRVSPDSAKTTAALMISSIMGPEKFAETFAKLGGERRADEEQPAKLEKLTAEAKEHSAKAAKAAVDARFAESNAVIDLQKKGWDITKIQEDISIAKENSRIAAMNAAIGRERNEIHREELKLKRDELVRKRDDDMKAKTAEVESARTNIDNFLNTADRIIATPNNVKRAAMGPIDSRLPTIQQDVADFEALMENFDAQAFISQLPSMKGLGALSNAEGQRLSSALQSFSLKQSPERFTENVKEAQRLLQKARKSLAGKYGVPDNVPDTPAAAAATTPDEVNDILKKYGVSPATR